MRELSLLCDEELDGAQKLRPLRLMNLIKSSQPVIGLITEPPLSPLPAASAMPPPNGSPNTPAIPQLRTAAPIEPPSEPTPTPQPPQPIPSPEPPPAAAAPGLAPAATPAPAPPGPSVEARLVQRGLLTVSQLAQAHRERLETGRPVLELAVERGWVSQADIEAVGSAVTAPVAPDPLPATVPQTPVAAPSGEVRPPVVVPTVAQVVEAPLVAPAPEPVLQVPVVAGVLTAPIAATPVEAPEPTPPQRFHIAIHLTGGERLEVGTGVDEEAAKALGREIVSQVSSSPDGGWPFFAGRFLRPDTIVSIDIVEQDAD